jgi:hypothetical protein
MQPDFHSWKIDEDCLLVIEADQMQPYTVFEKYIQMFQRFLCLAVQRPIYPFHTLGSLDKPERIVNGEPIFRDFLIIRKLLIPNSSQLMPQDQLFTLHEIGSSPVDTFGRFAARQEQLDAPLDLYFSTIYKESLLPRVEFLTLAQSLEAYHRTTMSGKYMDDTTYHDGLRKRLWESITTSPEINADFRASLNKQLDYLHEFSLRRRLMDLAKKHAAVLEAFIGSPEEFSGTVSDLRNQLTHPGEGNPKPEADYRRLIHLSETMALLIEVCFLSEIGFTQDRVKEIILNRSKRSYRLHRGWI